MGRKLLWLITAAIVFLTISLLAVDVYLYVSGQETLSQVIQTYTGGSLETWRAMIIGFVAGAVLTHLTRWN